MSWLEATNLLKEFGFAGGLGLLLTDVLWTENTIAAIQQLLSPWGDLPGMHLVLTGELAECFLLLDRFQSDPEHELGAAPLAVSGHALLHMRSADRNRSLRRVQSSLMGAVNTARLLNQFTTGYGDYTQEKERLFGAMTVDDIVQAIRKQKPTADL